MKKLPAQTIAEAFALSTARGADLLVELGTFKVWQGDLSVMRGDDPGVSAPSGATEVVPATELSTRNRS